MRPLAALAALGALSIAPAARAEDRTHALDAPAPPTLPSLAHPTLTYTFEFTGAGIQPATPASAAAKNDPPRAYAWFSHNEVEVPLVPRVWYLGAAHDLASGAVPGVGKNLFFGNPELWARGLWSSIVGLSSGGGLGVVLPLPRTLSPDALAILQTVRVVRPWDSSYFADRVLTLRPWIDVRHIAGRFILQFRQGLDVAVTLRSLQKNERRTDYIARASLYAGVRVTPWLGAGLEAWEVYQLSAEIPDDKRAAFTISPSVRLMLGRVAPAFSILVPVTTPLRGEAASYFAARFNVGFDFDLGRRTGAAAPHAPPDPGS